MKTVARCVGVPGDGLHHFVMNGGEALCGLTQMNWIEDHKDAGPQMCSHCVYEAGTRLCLVRKLL